MGWEWYMQVLKQYAVFSGRAPRREYWFFVLWYLIISIGLAVIDTLLGLRIGNAGLLQSLYALALLIPSIAVTVRRLHDTGRAGWWVLIVLVPLVGFIVLLIFMLLDTEPRDNEYGPAPKAAAA